MSTYMTAAEMAEELRNAKFPKGEKMTVDEVAAVVGPEFAEMNRNPPESVIKVRDEMQGKTAANSLPKKGDKVFIETKNGKEPGVVVDVVPGTDIHSRSKEVHVKLDGGGHAGASRNKVTLRTAANKEWARLFPAKSYLNMFFAEKDIPRKVFRKKDRTGLTHDIPNGVVVEHIAQTRGSERRDIENILRKIDFANGDINHFLGHLAGAIAENYEGALRAATSKYACGCESEGDETARFEEGESADPAENMSEEDAKKWRLQNLQHKDQFTDKEAAGHPAIKDLVKRMDSVMGTFAGGRQGENVKAMAQVLQAWQRDNSVGIAHDLKQVAEDLLYNAWRVRSTVDPKEVERVMLREYGGKVTFRTDEEFQRQRHTAKEEKDEQMSGLPSEADESEKTASAGAWGKVFDKLDGVFTSWNPNKVTDFNKALKAFRGNTNDAGAAAHHYNEYRSGRMTRDQAIKGLMGEGVRAPRLAAAKGKEPQIGDSATWAGKKVLIVNTHGYPVMKVDVRWTESGTSGSKNEVSGHKRNVPVSQIKLAAGGLYGYTKATQRDVDVSIRKAQKQALRIAKAAYGRDGGVVDFLKVHAKRANSRPARLLLAAMSEIGPKVASEIAKTAGSGAANAKYLASLPAPRKAAILKAVAKHYGVSVREIEGELTDRDAEPLYEYLAFDNGMAMQVLREFRGGRFASEDTKAASDKEGGYGMYGHKAKTATLGLNACTELRSYVGQVAYDLHSRRAAKHAMITGYLREHTKTSQCGYSRMLLGCYPEASKGKTASSPDGVDAWLVWDE